MPRLISPVAVALLALGAASGCKGEAESEGSDGAVPFDSGIVLASCGSNVDCSGGEVCRDGSCRRACAESAECAGGALSVCAPSKGFCVQCLANDDCPASQRCEAEACVPGCTSNASCKGGFACRDRTCVPLDRVICEANQERCVSNAIHRCSPDGTTEEVTSCGEDACALADGVASCVTRVCEPETFGCLDETTAYLCNEFGSERRSVVCRNGQSCREGVCRTPVCAPGTTSCAGNQRVVCSEDGSSFETSSCATDCMAEFGCACVEGDCVARTCTPGSGQCVANGVRLCNSSGTGWTTPETCPDVCQDGLCVSSTCEPHSTLCNGELLLTCNALGTGYAVSNCGDDNQTCAETADGRECVPLVCAPDEVSCSSDAREIVLCNSLGTSVNRYACAEDEMCDRGVCVDIPCVPDCSGRTCGLDPVCGVSCGTCAGTCTNGQCMLPTNSGLELRLTWTPSGQDLDLFLTKDGFGTTELCAATTCSNLTCTEDASRPDWDGSGSLSSGDPAMVDNGDSEVIRLVAPGASKFYAAVHAESANTNPVNVTLRVSRNNQMIGYLPWTLSPGELWNDVQIDLRSATPVITVGQNAGSVVGCIEGCTSDADCPLGQACASLSFPIPGNAGRCVTGCRHNADCAPLVCGGDNQCHGTVAPWRGSCASDADCREGLYCGIFSGVCEEACSSVMACGSDPTCCPVSNALYCRQDFFVNNCSDSP